jgi:hypothetical protein
MAKDAPGERAGAERAALSGAVKKKQKKERRGERMEDVGFRSPPFAAILVGRALRAFSGFRVKA